MTDHSKPSGYDPASPGGLNNTLILLLFVVGAVLLVVILASVEAWYYNYERNMIEGSYRRGNPQLEGYHEAQAQRLDRVHRIDGDPQHVTVPLDWAIDRFVAEHGKGIAN
jgi:hypothetical protein